MTTEEIAKKLYAHCTNHTEAEGLKELYAEDAVSIEPMSYGEMDAKTEGRDGIQGKHDWWNSAMEMHSEEVEGPYVHGDRFALVFEMDCTEKSSGNRWKAKEIGLYEVADGKIVKESFFMAPMG